MVDEREEFVLSKMILPDHVNLDGASTALRASARLIVHTGFHNIGHP